MRTIASNRGQTDTFDMLIEYSPSSTSRNSLGWNIYKEYINKFKLQDKNCLNLLLNDSIIFGFRANDESESRVEAYHSPLSYLYCIS